MLPEYAACAIMPSTDAVGSIIRKHRSEVSGRNYRSLVLFLVFILGLPGHLHLFGQTAE